MDGEILSANNWSTRNLLEKTEVLVAVNAGDNTVTVLNAQGFIADTFIKIGEGEQAEIREVDSIAGNVITIVGTFQFAHKRFERVQRLFGDRIRFMRAPNVDGKPPADDTYELLGAVNIEADQAFTLYDDPTGGVNYWYKYTYNNSATGDTTNIAHSKAVRGGNIGEFTSVYDIRVEAGFDGNDAIHDTTIKGYQVAAQGIAKGVIGQRYTLPLSSVPDVLSMAVKLIAAGLLLQKTYGLAEEGTNKEGKAKYDLGIDLLTKIGNGTIPLLDEYDNPLTQVEVNTEGIDGYPNSGDPIMSMDMEW
jgi:phage gp36-like protein